MFINKKTFYDLQVGYKFEIKEYECKNIPYTHFMATKFVGAEYVMIHYLKHNDPLKQNQNILSVTIYAPKKSIKIDNHFIKAEGDLVFINKLIPKVLH